MLIVCPSCETSYDVEAATLQPDGRRVRCVRCRAVWLAEPSRADKLLAAADALAPAPEMAVAEESGFEATAEAPAEAAVWEESTIRQAEDGDAYVPPLESPSDPELEAAPDRADAPVAVEAPPIVPVDLDEGQPPVEAEAEEIAEPAEDIETYAARRAKRTRGSRLLGWPLSRLQTGILALLIADALLIAGRRQLVHVMPQTASFYSMMGLNVNLRGIAFEGVGTTIEQKEGPQVLVVEGNIVNDSRKPEDVPRLKFAVRNASGQEVYSWTAAPPRPALAPGEAIAFQSRLASPPVEAHDVLVRFVTRRDVPAGAH